MLEQRRNDPRRVAPNGVGGWLECDVREMKRLMNHWRPVEAIVSGYGEGTSPCENNTSDSPNPATRSNETNSTYANKRTLLLWCISLQKCWHRSKQTHFQIYICFFICYSSIILTIYFHHMSNPFMNKFPFMPPPVFPLYAGATNISLLANDT